MGLRFCNEAVMCLRQIHPPMADKHEKEALTPLQVDISLAHSSPAHDLHFNGRCLCLRLRIGY